MKTKHPGSLLRPALLGALLATAVQSPAFAGDKDKSKPKDAAPAQASGASLVGGALPGGAIVSAREAPVAPAPAKQTQTQSFGEKVQSGMAQTGSAINQGATGARAVNNINGGMPNRISTNVTVPKQTQTQSFGEKVNQGLAQTGNAVSQGAALKEGVDVNGTPAGTKPAGNVSPP